MRLRSLVLLALAVGTTSLALAIPLRILATGDMHGMIDAQRQDGLLVGGAAEMLAYWKTHEGYKPQDFLLISCGDNASGPAISQAYKGEPAITVMNLMGYDVSTFGTHEFDFGPDFLKRAQQVAKFPFVSANLTNADGTLAAMTVPYTLYEEQGVRVGIIGLTLQTVGAKANTRDLVGQPYAPVVKKLVPELKAKGAQVIIVVAHAPSNELAGLANQLASLDIPLILGGYSHEFGETLVGRTWIVNSGSNWAGYSRIDLDFSPQTGKTIVTSTRQVLLRQDNPEADPEVAAEISRWKAKLAAEFGKPLGYTVNGLARPWAVSNFVTDCWLAGDPQSDIALTNLGGFQLDISTGPISKITMMGVMPFLDALYRVTVTGEQLLAYVPPEPCGMAGVRFQDGKMLFKKTGEPIDPKATYKLLTTDFLYFKSPTLCAADPKPVRVQDDWRQPVYDWLEQHATNMDKPLEWQVDIQPRVRD